MKKIWLKSYPKGVPAEAELAAFTSINDLFACNVAHFADSPAYFSMGTTLSYAEIDRLSGQFASFLRNVARVPRGSGVALMLPNLLQYPVAMFGVLRAGCTVVNCNPLYTPRELHHQLIDSGADAIVVFEARAFVLQAILEGTAIHTVVVTDAGDLLAFPRGAAVNFVLYTIKHAVPPWHIPGAITFNAALRQGAAEALQPVQVAPDDVAFLQYTRRHNGRAKRRDVDARQSGGEHAAGLCVDLSVHDEAAGDRHIGASTVSYFRPYREPDLL
jgi:long-chain acyl-CoA synthetase